MRKAYFIPVTLAAIVLSGFFAPINGSCTIKKDSDRSSESIQEISILTREGDLIKTITEQRLIEQIELVLSNETAVAQREWDYFIDITKGNKSARWLYSSKNGTLQKLSSAKNTIYRIKNYGKINQIWGIREETMDILFYERIDGNPVKITKISDSTTMEKLYQYYEKLPKNGDIFKKIDSSSPKYEIIFPTPRGGDILQINIYNDSVQCENTGFLDGSTYVEEEKALIELVKELSQ